jgi:hypothetical protein
MRKFSSKLRQSYGWAAGIEKTPLGSGCTVIFWRKMCQVSARFSVTDPGQELIAAGPPTAHGQLNGR